MKQLSPEQCRPAPAQIHVGVQALEANRAESEHFARVARFPNSTAFPEAYPDPDDFGPEAA